MSWIDKIQTDFTITTGDGKKYVPYWVNASKGIEYNIAIFEFKELAGSLAKRGLPKGTRYAIELGFQGEDHVEVTEAFLKSSENPAPWQVEHPLYGNLLVQPISLAIGNEEMNTSQINGMIIETITDNAASVSKLSPIDKIVEDKQATDKLFNASFANDVPNIDAADTTNLTNSVNNSYNAIANKIKTSLDTDSYFNAYNNAVAVINSPVYDTITTIQAAQVFLTMPYDFADSVASRINMFSLQLNMLRGTIETLFTRTSKKIYENNAGQTISSMLLAAVTGIGNAYVNALDVFGIIDILVNSYNQFLDDLDHLQSDNGGDPDSYIPDADSVTSLSQLAGFTINALLDIASAGKQQRVIYLQSDSNIINVAHEVYGYTGDDSIFELLIGNNDIGLNEMLMLEKGRKIIYYI